MTLLSLIAAACLTLPGVLMLLAMLPPRREATPVAAIWRLFNRMSAAALVFASLAGVLASNARDVLPWLNPTALGSGLAVLVQLLGTVIGVFSSRYLEGEARQRSYIAALAGVVLPEVVMANGQLISTWQDARVFAAVAAVAVYFWRKSPLQSLLAGMAVYLPLHLGLGW